jgi:large subunit ribosomal protein L2
MGKMLKHQRRGKGSPSYKSPGHRSKVDLRYRECDKQEAEGSFKGEITEFVDDPAHHAVLMKVLFENNEERILLAPEGALIGGRIEAGAKSELTLGGVLPLSSIPDGTSVYNVELRPSDGGKVIRSPGSYGVVVSKEEGKVLVKMPSKSVLLLDERCRAQVGVVSGGGRLDLPLMKAGTSFYIMNARNRRWPTVRGVHMCSYTHPFGGKGHHKGKSSCTARGTPPGRKVGHIAARAVGRRENRKKVKVE